jgi:hypothetical protein
VTPAQYLDQIVLPVVREFRDARHLRHRAYVACIVLYQLKDYLSKAGERGVHRTMARVATIAFDVVRGVCNGTKHVEADASHPIPFRAGDDRERPPTFAGRMRTGRTRLGDKRGGLDIKAGSGRADLYECVKAVSLAFKSAYPNRLRSCDLSDL